MEILWLPRDNSEKIALKPQGTDNNVIKCCSTSTVMRTNFAEMLRVQLLPCELKLLHDTNFAVINYPVDHSDSRVN